MVCHVWRHYILVICKSFKSCKEIRQSLKLKSGIDFQLFERLIRPHFWHSHILLCMFGVSLVETLKDWVLWYYYICTWMCHFPWPHKCQNGHLPHTLKGSIKEFGHHTLSEDNGQRVQQNKSRNIIKLTTAVMWTIKLSYPKPQSPIQKWSMHCWRWRYKVSSSELGVACNQL